MRRKERKKEDHPWGMFLLYFDPEIPFRVKFIIFGNRNTRLLDSFIAFLFII